MVENVYLGVALSGGTVHVSTSLGQRSAISVDGIRTPEDWIELATYGVPLPEQHVVLACVAISSGYPTEDRRKVVEASRLAGWDGVLLIKSLTAARRALREQTPEELALVVVDPIATSVGLHLGGRATPLVDDPVRPIPGREAREVAISLRVMLKGRPREEQRQLLRRVVVSGDPHEVERIGRREFERELERLGARQVEFQLDPFLLAEGARLVAEGTESGVWRRLRQRR